MFLNKRDGIQVVEVILLVLGASIIAFAVMGRFMIASKTGGEHSYNGIVAVAQNIDLYNANVVISTPDNSGTSIAPTATKYPTRTLTPTQTYTPTITPTKTNTLIPPTATKTNTPVTPTATATATKTNTLVPPTATKTNTPVPPTATKTNTPVPPTATKTNTPVPPTATFVIPTLSLPTRPPTRTPRVYPTIDPGDGCWGKICDW